MFAVDRIRSLTVTAHAFQLPLGFDAEAYVRVADTRELTGWILSFGRGVRVVRPAALRERVRQEALARQCGVVTTVRPSRRRSSSNAKQGM
jgi:predicted DNA-binding transcriptional regulator YafY